MDVADSDATTVVGVHSAPLQRRTELPVAFEFAAFVQAKSISLEETAVAEMRVGAGGAEPPVCARANCKLKTVTWTPMNHIATLAFRIR